MVIFNRKYNIYRLPTHFQLLLLRYLDTLIIIENKLKISLNDLE